MAARHHSRFKCILYRCKIHVHCLSSCHLQLFKNVVIAAGNQNACLPDAKIPNHAKVFATSPNPGRNLRETKPQRHAAFNRFAVAFGVDEEFRLPDESIRPPQARHQFEQCFNLFGCVRAKCLLPVTEGSIGYPDILRHAHRHTPMVERNLRYLIIVIDIPVKNRVFNILK